MEKTLKEIADAVCGEIVGNSFLKIKNVSNIDDARPGDLVFLIDNKYLSKIKASKASAVITTKDIKDISKPHIKVQNPRLAFAIILKMFEPKKKFTKGIHRTAIIGKGSRISKSASIMSNSFIGDGSIIGSNVKIFPGCFIGDNCTVGADTVINSNVSIYDRTQIGERCILHSGVVLGSDGYGFAPDGEKWVKIPQIGNVIIEDDVELCANVSVAKGTLGSTIIKSGTKIDNLTHIAHNCVIGENCAITALIAIAGSSRLGNHVTIAGMSGVSDHVNVGDNVMIMSKSGVTKDVPSNSVVSGFPARDHKKQMESQAIFNQLPKIVENLKEIEEKLSSKGGSASGGKDK